MTELLLFIILILCSYAVTELIRQYTLKQNLIDIPNARSSHSVPTPRGGGAAIVLSFIAGLLVLWSMSILTNAVFMAIAGATVWVSLIGFIDDHGHIAARWRLISHFVAASWILYWLGDMPTLPIMGYQLELGWFGFLLAAVALVWLLNLFNFMDGIDGIAASEAVFVSISGGLFVWFDGQQNIALLCFTFSAASLGFLVQNWPPAKIFMGDVGSGFLGLTLGTLAYISASDGLSLWVWLILLGVFLIDATFTLIRRILLGQRWYEAHCNHAYQWAARRWGHLRVTLVVNMINLLWLLPFASVAYVFPDWGLVILLLGFSPLVVLAFKLNAGLEQEPNRVSAEA